MGTDTNANSSGAIGQSNLCINHESWGELIVVLEGISIIVGNLFVLTVLGKYSGKRFRPLNCFITQLALSDLCVGGIVFWIGFLSPKVFDYITLSHGIVNYGVLASGSSVSTLTVLFIAIDRYIYILKHQQYKQIMTRKVVYCGLIAAWVLPTCVFIIAPLSGWSCVSSCDCSVYNDDQDAVYCQGYFCSQMMTPFRKETLIVGGMCLLLSLVMSVMVYVLVILQVRRKAKHFIRNKGRKESEMKLIRTMIIVLGGFLLTTGPLAILCILSYFHNARHLHSIMRIMVVISNVNSIMNPFFYFLRIPYMTKNLRKLWKSVIKKFSANASKIFRKNSRSTQTPENSAPVMLMGVQEARDGSHENAPTGQNVDKRNSEDARRKPRPALLSFSSGPWSSNDFV